MNRRATLAPFLTALTLALPWGSPAVAQTVPECELRVLDGGRLRNDAHSGVDLTATQNGSSIRLGRRATVTSVSGAMVGLGNGASAGAVNTNDLRLGKEATVGSQAPFTASAFVCDVPPVTCGGPNVRVARGKSGSFPPGTYGNVELLNGSTLRLLAGTYTFCSIKSGRGATLQIAGPTQSVINVAGDLRMGNGSVLPGADDTPTPLVNVLGERVKFGAHSIIRAFIKAPNAQLTLGTGAMFKGAACATELAASRRVEVSCAPDTTTTTATSSTSTSTTTSTTTTSTTTTTTAPTSTTTTSTTTTTTGPAVTQCCVPGSAVGAFPGAGSPIGGLTCELLTAAECAEAGGTDAGPGSCSPDPCGPSTTTTTTTTSSTTITTPPTTTTTTTSTTITAPPTTTTTTTSTTTTTTGPAVTQCCIPGSVDGAFTCELLTAADCSENRGTDAGPGSCSPDPCGPSTTTSSSTTTTPPPTTSTTTSSTTTTAPSTTTTAPPTTTTSTSTTITAPPTTTTTSTSTTTTTTTTSTSTTVPTTTTAVPTTTTTTTSTTTTTTPPPPTILDFTNGVAGGVCGDSRNAANAVIKNLTCGGLDIGGGGSQIPEGPTPSGSVSRFNLSCAGSSCTVSANTTVPGVSTAAPDCTTTGCNFGTPLPIPNPAIPSISTCVVNKWGTPASGTLNLATGGASLGIPLASDVYLTGLALCPKCSATGSPGTPGVGTCVGGLRNGLACTSTNPAGLTRDCVPTNTTKIGTISVNLSPSETNTRTSTNATGQFCPGQTVTAAGCFGSTACRTINENGVAAGALTIGTPKNAVLGSTFCIPGTGNGAVDGSANLPGPGAVSLPGTFTVH